MKDEAAQRSGYIDAFVGTSGTELQKLTDAELALFQSENSASSAKHILAEKEWELRQARQLLKEQFKLDERLATSNYRAMLFAAIIGVFGTLAGAYIGANSKPDLPRDYPMKDNASIAGQKSSNHKTPEEDRQSPTTPPDKGASHP